MKLWIALCAFYLTLNCHKTASTKEYWTWSHPTEQRAVVGSSVCWSKSVAVLISHNQGIDYWDYEGVMSPINLELSMGLYFLNFLSESRGMDFLKAIFGTRICNENKNIQENKERMKFLLPQMVKEAKKCSSMSLELYTDETLSAESSANIKTAGFVNKGAVTNLQGVQIEQSVNTVLFSTIDVHLLWKNKFEAVTEVELFDGQYSESFITNTGEYFYEDNTEGMFEVLSIPTQDAKVSLYIFLPYAGSSLHLMTTHLTEFSHLNWVKNRQMVLSKVKVTIPKFEMRHAWYFKPLAKLAASLTNELNEEEKMEFEKIQVVQSQYFKIGAAGLATAKTQDVDCCWTEENNIRKGGINGATKKSMMSALGMLRKNAINFSASRPFMFALVHVIHKIVLLQGYVNEIDTYQGKKRRQTTR